VKTNAGIMATEVAHVTARSDASKEPSLWSLLFIFWGATAAAIAAVSALNPDFFVRDDPDSFMRLVEVRDLLAGQGWLDLMQYRVDPPDGVLMHWSRVIDAPIAGLILFGDLFGAGERFAQTAWPLLLLFALMAGIMFSATALAGHRAAVPALILIVVSLEPLILYLPNNIDHHNAQIALLALMLATALRIDKRPWLGAALGSGLALMLAIGLETLPYVAVLGVAVALAWGLKALSGRSAAFFGLAFGSAPAVLYLLTGSPEAPLACDSLSWAFALPAAVAGFGLASLALFFRDRSGATLRIVGLGVLGGVTLATILSIAPQCLSGPYGQISPELKAAFLAAVTEAQPIWDYAGRQPAAAIALLGPPMAAIALALLKVWAGPRQSRVTWALPLALLGVALALGLYQVRTLPYAFVASITVLAAWVAELAARHNVTSLRPSSAMVPVLAGFLVACPFTYYGIGGVAVDTLSFVTDGRVAPPETPTAPRDEAEGLTAAQTQCIDAGSAALLASVPDGLVLSPVLYGSAVLYLSAHSVVAAPYHRAGAAILDAIKAMQGAPAEAHAIIERRKVDYVAICATSREAAVGTKRAPDGLLATLLSGLTPAWLSSVPQREETALRLWRVTGLRGRQP